MRRVGLIGGMSWAATLGYYEALNRLISEKLGRTHSADMLVRSLDFETLLARADDHGAVEHILFEAAEEAVRGGAQCIALASFTGHSYATQLRRMEIPFIDLIEALASALLSRKLAKVGVFATGRSLQDQAILDTLTAGGKIELVAPAQDRQQAIDKIIFEELAFMRLSEPSRELLSQAATELESLGAETILFATTEFSRFHTAVVTNCPVLDALALHCSAIAEYTLRSGKE